MVAPGAQVDRVEQPSPHRPMNLETKVTFPEDATHTEQVFFFGSRGVALSDLTVHFEAESQLASWHEVVAKLNVDILKDGRTSRAAFFALPERLEKFRPFLTAMVTWDEDAPSRATWDFRWSRAQDDSPPESIVRSSRAVGGFPNIFDRLGALWPVSSPVEARVSARYFVFGADWRFTLAPAGMRSVVAGEQVFKVRPSRWTVVPPSGCVSEISQALSPHSEKDFEFGGQGTYTFQWTPRFLNEVDGAIWDGLRTFLKARRPKKRR